MKKSQGDPTTAKNLEDKFDRSEDVLDYFDAENARVTTPESSSSGGTSFSGQTSEAQVLTLDDAGLLLRGHVGLICGPAISRPSASLSSVASGIVKKFGGTEGRSYLHNGQEVIRLGTKVDDLKATIREIVSSDAIKQWPAEGRCVLDQW